MADLRDIFVTIIRLSGVDKFALRQNNQLIEKRHDVTAGLMDRKYNRAVVISCKRD